MKAYCENCTSLQPSSFRPGNDAVTSEPYEDLRCNTCGFIVATVQEREAALAQPEQEPVAWLRDPKHYPEPDLTLPHVTWERERLNIIPLFTPPPKRKPLSEVRISDLMPTNSNMSRTDELRWMARAVEREHDIKEKNT